jgi:molybdate transport system substrate-binding protein
MCPLPRPLFCLALLGSHLLACASEAPDREVLRVFAASSLTEVFQDLEASFEETHPKADIQLSFAGSQVLRVQLEHGARADVFASANRDHLQALSAAGLAGEAEVFAHNGIALVAPQDNPADIHSLEDLPGATRIVLGTPEVPVGRYARDLLARATKTLGEDFADRVMARVVSLESNTRLVRAKVIMGEADAALLYETDALGAPSLHRVSMPAGLDVRVSCAAAVLADTPRRPLAEAWLDHLRSPAGRKALTGRGFEASP